GSLLVLILIPAWRLFYGSVVLKAIGTRRVLFLGTSPTIREIAAHLADLPGGKVIGGVEDLAGIAKELKPDLIVVGMTERRQELPVNEMLHLRFSGIHFEEAQVTFETTFGRVL